ncbi:MAG TPA: glycosyltransferase family 2 protein [Allosphingosinicella sp.]|jgi:glycosyltransferase involved in cell wall biosynthesis
MPDSARPGDRRPTIEVCLTTYNSEPYLPALLDSLFAQTRQGFTLLIADDDSTDGTRAIVESYSKRFPGRIVQLPEGPRRGVIGNFDRVLARADADYVFLCDHDDVWLPHKIEQSLEAMHALEARHEPGVPLLVHTDLIITGPRLEILGHSFFEYAGGDPLRNDLEEILLSNVVTGCTTVINRPLRLQARPVPDEAMMHDHWLALVAATTGAIGFIDDATILYRQHGRNAIGARRRRTSTFFQRVYGTLVSRERERVLKRYSRQAAVLLARFGECMSPRHRAAVETLAGLWDKPRLSRFAALRRCGLGLDGLARNLALFVVVTRADSSASGGADRP